MQIAATVACCVCLGLWEDDAAPIQQAIDKACEPYGGIETNRFSMDEAPSVAIPGDVALRYHLALSLEGSRAATDLADFLRHLKSHVKKVALDYVMSRQAKPLEGYPPCVEKRRARLLVCSYSDYAVVRGQPTFKCRSLCKQETSKTFSWP